MIYYDSNKFSWDASFFLSQEKESKLYFLYLIDEYIYKYNTS